MQLKLGLWGRDIFYVICLETKLPYRYLGSHLLLMALGLGLLIIMGYKDSFLWLNGHNHPLFDRVMPHLTHLADGVILTCIFVLFRGKNNLAWIFTALLGFFVLGFCVNLLKYQVFSDWNRPGLYLQAGSFHLISVQGECCNTLPSGHSATASIMFFFFALLLERRAVFWGYFLALFAVVLGYTRIYIGVHYLGDVLAGQLLGLVVACLTYLVVYKPIEQKLNGLPQQTQSYLRMFFVFASLALLLWDVKRIYEIYV